MKRLLFFCFLLLPALLMAQGQRKKYTTTPVYDSIIATYKAFDKKYLDDTLLTCGLTDVGKPLHLYVLSKDRQFQPDNTTRRIKATIMINNGIHPGEPDGVDACIELVKALHAQPDLLPDNVMLLIVPIYNIDGCLNRGSYSRANQNGPEEYGFRGNARNLDLNRDFIKCDAANTRSLETLFNRWNPDIFVDTHVSDGADYQYTLTLIASQHNKLSPVLSSYMTKELVPALYDAMKAKKTPLSPYVETKGNTPETGIVEFTEPPRFSTGYAALRNTMGFVTETHMWKPYNDRVWATYDFLQSLLVLTAKDARKIIQVHNTAGLSDATMKDKFLFNWELDTAKFEMIDFTGYEAKYKTSNISGQQRMYYDRKAPYTKQVRFYNQYHATDSVRKPVAYIIPQAWHEVVERLILNGVDVQKLRRDTVLRTEVYYIDSYETSKSPYEGHYIHSNIKLHTDTQQIAYYKGDYVVKMNTISNRYVIETLEPKSEDSFFAWGFFDAILQQKEWFSDYIFEEKAEEILKKDPKLKAELDAKKASDKDFAANNWAQLNFIYQHSVYKEKSHNRYPVGHLLEIEGLRLTH